MSRDIPCKKPAEHQQHLCVLEKRLSRADLAALKKNPQYVCANCGGRVNRGKNLCVPKRIRT